MLAREGLWMLARVGLDEKHAPGDVDTQAPDDNARLKARRRSVLFWWAGCPRCTSASLCWGVESETAGGPARRRVGRSGEEGGLGESVPLRLESENLSPNSRPPPIVDPAAVTMWSRGTPFRGSRFLFSLQRRACLPRRGRVPRGSVLATTARLLRLGAWLRTVISLYVPSISPPNFAGAARAWQRVAWAASWRVGAVRGAVGAMSVARPTYIRGGSINSRTSFLVRRRPVGPS